MDFGKKLEGAKYECQRGKDLYRKADSQEQQEQGIQHMEKGLGIYKMLLQAGAPAYLQTTIKSLIASDEPTQEQMKKNLGRIAQTEGGPKKGGGGGGGKGDAGDDEGDEFKKKLSEAIVSEKPDVKWEDVAGLQGAKNAIQEAVIMPIKFPNFFTGIVRPWKGILLYGPPGTGKTMLAKACANEVDSTFFSMSSSDLISKYVGESAKLIATLFNMARDEESSVIFIDEVDSLVGTRQEGENEATRQVKTEFLVQMDGVGSGRGKLLILAATNIPWGLDDAFLRRFQKRVYIDLPDYEARRYLLEVKQKKTPNVMTDADYNDIASKTENYSGADLSILCKDAAMVPLRFAQKATKWKRFNENGKVLYMAMDNNASGPDIESMGLYDLPDNGQKLPDMNHDHFVAALKSSKATVNPADLGEFVDWTNQFGMDGA